MLNYLRNDFLFDPNKYQTVSHDILGNSEIFTEIFNWYFLLWPFFGRLTISTFWIIDVFIGHRIRAVPWWINQNSLYIFGVLTVVLFLDLVSFSKDMVPRQILLTKLISYSQVFLKLNFCFPSHNQVEYTDPFRNFSLIFIIRYTILTIKTHFIVIDGTFLFLLLDFLLDILFSTSLFLVIPPFWTLIFTVLIIIFI